MGFDFDLIDDSDYTHCYLDDEVCEQAQGLIRNYLMADYEPLHTQSYEYVAESTVETLRNWDAGHA